MFRMGFEPETSGFARPNTVRALRGEAIINDRLPSVTKHQTNFIMFSQLKMYRIVTTASKGGCGQLAEKKHKETGSHVAR
jgi:hypothetical protein